MVDPWRGPFGRWVERIDLLHTKPGDLVMYEVTPHHAFGQTILIGLIDDAATVVKIALDVAEKVLPSGDLFDAATQSVTRLDLHLADRLVWT